MRIKTFYKIGFFDEKYFIDFIDTDFCLRCKEKGILIYQIPNIYLYQTIGNKKIQILCFSFYFHNNERLYYQIRNSFYFFSKKKKYVPFLYGLREIFSVLFHHFILFFHAKKN